MNKDCINYAIIAGQAWLLSLDSNYAWVGPENLGGPQHTQLDEEIHVGPHSKRTHIP